MQSFIKIGLLVLEKISNKKQTLCNFNKDTKTIDIDISKKTTK